MTKEQIKKLVSIYGKWRVVQAMLVGMIAVCVIVIVSSLLIPVNIKSMGMDIPTRVLGANDDYYTIVAVESIDDSAWVTSIRSGLFKARSGISREPMADKTIDRIKSQLKLQCIVPIAGEPVAYIDIKGQGLKKCRMGDVFETFSVIEIKQKSVDIKIVGHTITLHR